MPIFISYSIVLGFFFQKNLGRSKNHKNDESFRKSDLGVKVKDSKMALSPKVEMYSNATQYEKLLPCVPTK